MQLVRGKKLISEQALPLPLPLPLSPPGPSLPSPAAKKFALQRSSSGGGFTFGKK